MALFSQLGSPLGSFTPGINPNEQQDPVLQLLTEALTGRQQAYDPLRQVLSTPPTPAATQPRPGAIAISALADLILNKGKGDIVQNFTGGYRQGAEQQNQQRMQEWQNKLSLAELDSKVRLEGAKGKEELAEFTYKAGRDKKADEFKREDDARLAKEAKRRQLSDLSKANT